MYLLIFVSFTNLPFVSEVLAIFFYATVGAPFCFRTLDGGFGGCGGIERVKQNGRYILYKKKFPNASHTLYCVNREREWKYFLCGEYT